ncbi:MAG: hypothetical protein CR967_03000 [Proteobacteria bacterium]|nr:MAG: hypothetical protein CR967_03000 [Pseudomonadota bacterium]
MNDLFDDLKAIKSQLKKEETPKAVKKPKNNKSKEVLLKEKEEELRVDFLDYMKNSQVKKI